MTLFSILEHISWNTNLKPTKYFLDFHFQSFLTNHHFLIDYKPFHHLLDLLTLTTLGFSGPYQPGGCKVYPYPMNTYTTVVRGLVFGHNIVQIKFRKNPYFGLSPIFGSGTKRGQYFKKRSKSLLCKFSKKLHISENIFSSCTHKFISRTNLLRF